MHDSMTIFSLVYVLKLDDECWYVGKTHSLNHRLAQHFAGQGSKWTKLHPPLKLSKVYMNESEKEITDLFIKIYGKDRVRGGSWTRCSNTVVVKRDLQRSVNLSDGDELP